MKRQELTDCLQEQLASYPGLKVTEQYSEAWFKLFKTVHIYTFSEALMSACRNSKPGFPPAPSDVQVALNDMRGSSSSLFDSTASKKEQVFPDAETGMDKVLTTTEKLVDGKFKTETRVHYRANQSHVMKVLKDNFEKGVFMEEYTTSAGIKAYKWTAYPNKANRVRIECVDNVDIPVYAR